MATSNRRQIKTDAVKEDAKTSPSTLEDAAQDVNTPPDLPEVSNVVVGVDDAAAIVELTEGERIRVAMERKLVEDLADVVTVVSPVAFTLTLDNGGHVDFPQGTSEQVRAHAAHWHSRARGVKIVE